MEKMKYKRNMSHSQMLGKVEYGLPAKIWKVGSIKIESAAGRRIFLQVAMEIRENGNFLVFGLQLENDERYQDGSNE